MLIPRLRPWLHISSNCYSFVRCVHSVLNVFFCAIHFPMDLKPGSIAANVRSTPAVLAYNKLIP